MTEDERKEEMDGIKAEKKVSETEVIIKFGMPFGVPYAFTLNDDLTKALRDGEDITVTFCHPKHGIKFIAEKKKQ